MSTLLMNLSHHMKTFKMFISGGKCVQIFIVCMYNIGTCSRAIAVCCVFKACMSLT